MKYGRLYQMCSACGSVQMHRDHIPSMKDEQKRYLEHNNEGEKYEAYLSAILHGIEPYLAGKKRHLDYGCGPNPVLSMLAESYGLTSDYYDPVFFPDMPWDEGKYDIITVIETAEHFHDPRREFEKIRGLLNEEGTIVVRTHMYLGQDLESWWYLRDQTHVFFYSPQSVELIQEYVSMGLEELNDRGFVLHG